METTRASLASVVSAKHSSMIPNDIIMALVQHVCCSSAMQKALLGIQVLRSVVLISWEWLPSMHFDQEH